MRLKIGLIVVSLIPIQVIRHLFYKTFYNYKISKDSKIGMFNYIQCSELVLNAASIGSFNLIIVKNLTLDTKARIIDRNRIKHLNKLAIKEGGLINKLNFVGGQEFSHGAIIFEHQNLTLGKRSEINRHNYFDVIRPITIGDNVVFGGEGSEIWTHGFEINRNMLTGDVSFGNDIFIGSKCIFTKNVHIVSNVTIGPGSVIYKSITESGVYSTHQINKIK